MNEFSLKLHWIHYYRLAEARWKHFRVHNILSQLAHFLHICSNCCTSRRHDDTKIKNKSHEKKQN